MTSFFQGALGGNPFATPVGNRIESATDASLASENWALNMEICDLVNETEDGPRDAIKAIRKRLATNAGKNYTVVMYTLTVLETCVKNCGRRFHLLACGKDFIQELVKLIGPKNDPPTAVQEKVLSLIQSWADAFSNQPELAGVVAVYQDLKAKGIEFPATDLDSMAPIHTPQKSVEADAPPMEGGGRSYPSSPAPHLPTPPGVLTQEQRAKLQSELDLVQSNQAVFGELLNEMKPGQEQHPSELELLQELNTTCHKMQERLVELISKLSNDELTAELLRVNDDMNNLFLRYSRWENNREGRQGQSASTVLGKAIPKPKVEEDSLIDFGPPEDLTDQLSKMGVTGVSASDQLASVGTVKATNGPPGNDEFDMFAQSRKASYEGNKTTGSSYKDNLEPDQLAGGLSTATQNRATTEESVTSSEFDRFLAERAAAADALPSNTSTTTASSNRTPKKEDKEGLLAR
ncbi:TOM1-like protein 2 isoform X2 [Atheta coriaria]|uniref:TOM1-like protein 2 isoform X2 n=1 Tax=Dalotia coriaria TaxID=877792 RepID=UPI0031F35A29